MFFHIYIFATKFYRKKYSDPAAKFYSKKFWCTLKKKDQFFMQFKKNYQIFTSFEKHFLA
jgi:hypothetical protein